MGDFTSSDGEFDGGSPFRNPDDPRSSKDLLEAHRLVWLIQEGVLTTNEVLITQTDGPPTHNTCINYKDYREVC